ncbi:hypothetical protein MASR1M31_06840 [Porphyromonadaceae bacterium]
MINVGDKSPEILGKNENGEEIRLSSYKGKKVALYFYPKDNTSGCTAQACSLRDGYTYDLKNAGYEVIGVSVWTMRLRTENSSKITTYPSP